MNSFEKYFSKRQIVEQLCKVRVKIAQQRSRQHLLHLLTEDDKYNYHVKAANRNQNELELYQQELIKKLNSVLPPRKEWVRLGENSRRKQTFRKEVLTSADINKYSLLKTIKSESKKSAPADWYLNLKAYIAEIQNSVFSGAFVIGKPIVVPKLKERLSKTEVNDCRPICLYGLTDRIVLSLTNKFLSDYLDEQFQDCSYAFRVKRNIDGRRLSHHDCIRNISEYLKANAGKDLYVLECDMRKFYDTVNHDLALKKFKDLIAKVETNNPGFNVSIPTQIFESYLASFAFNIDIPKPSDIKYWSSYKIPNGEFSWVEKYIGKYYDDYTKERIGVPQGGALSGLIANFYLNDTDILVNNDSIRYQRFCDDMIIVSNSLEDIEKAKLNYQNSLFDLKLIPHEFRENHELVTEIMGKKSYKPFWEGKSKGPYPWGSIEDNKFPWIGFVGYEINYQGEIRVRKKSFKKELNKQRTIVRDIRRAVKYKQRKAKGTVIESAINRLIGMSVGRINLYNYKYVSTELCWSNGFRELTSNRHSILQIKHLDRCRNKLYYDLFKQIDKPKEDIKSELRIPNKYDKPFSYYYHVIEKRIDRGNSE